MNEPQLESGWGYPFIGYIDIREELEKELTKDELHLLDKLSAHVDFPDALIYYKDDRRVNTIEELSELAGLDKEETKVLFDALIDKEVACYRWFQPKGQEKQSYFYLNPYIFIVAKDIGKISFLSEDLFSKSRWADYNRKHFKVNIGKVPREKYSYRKMKINPKFWDYEFDLNEYADDEVVKSIVETLNRALKGHKYVSFLRYSDGAVIQFSHSRNYDHPSVGIENDDGDVKEDIPRMRYIEQFQKKCGLKYNIKVTYSGDRIKIAKIDK